MTDSCVGIIVQPLFAAFLMRIASENWRIIYLTLSFFNFAFCGFSFATATAISVDRLLALLLGLRYRHTVTLRRVRCLAVCFLLVSTVNGFMHSLFSRDFAKSVGFVVIIISLFLSVFSHVKIFLKLRQYRAEGQQRVGHEHAIGGGIPLNIERYKKTVWTIALVQLALVFCYFPLFIYLILAMATNWYRTGSVFLCTCINSRLFQFHPKPDPFLLENTWSQTRGKDWTQWNRFVVSQINLAFLPVIWRTMLTIPRWRITASNY